MRTTTLDHIKEKMIAMRALSLTLILALFLFAAATPSFAKGGDSPAAGFVQKLGDKALTSLTAKGLPKGERGRRVRTLLNDNFDIPTIGKFVLGTHWKEATDAQRAEYTKLFEDMIVETYTQRFQDYSGQSFKVLSSESSGNDTMVMSQIVQKDGPPVDVDWRVRNKGGGMKIVDVLVDKISMSVTQRDDFDGVIQSGGGNVDALLNSLRKHQVKVGGK
jgi:phospholipid transport system substrate-binding protein